MMNRTHSRTTFSRYLTVCVILAAVAVTTTCSRPGSEAIDLIVVFSSEVMGYLEACG